MIDVRGARDRARAIAARGFRSVFSRRALPAWITVGTLAAAAAALIAVGAFDTAENEPAATALGEEVRLPTYSITVLDVEVTDAVEEQFLEADEGESLLLVTMRLENLSDSTIGVDGSADEVSSNLLNTASPMLDLSGVTEIGSARYWRDVTSSRRPLLQPEVPAVITVAWTVKTADLGSDGIVLDVHEADPRHGNIVVASSAVTWRQGALVARIDLEAGG
ncbi:MAG: hypothetical protein JF592_14505 [Microbacterium sp.]|uniref:hypothetical protein n=1 Tax=Microbacterium sp. TaxID=51671 RepID=UPI001D9F9000|nr:hypothetical protein [Microbacterium sp.]MBW8763771.1 hypothetical protein [Microbacterium sp.]